MISSPVKTLMQRMRVGWPACILLLIGVGLSGAMAPEATAPLRACVLDYDMPLSSESADAQGRSGLYLDLAKQVAEAQDRSLETHFAVTAFYKRPVKEGLLAGKCDAYFGLPRSGGPWFVPGKVKLSEPFMRVGYAVVMPGGQSVQTLEDLRGKTIGVLGGSPAVIALARMDIISTHTYREVDPALEALDAGEIDAAFVWGPRAGYLNKFTYGGAFNVQPTAMEWPVAIGVRAEDAASLDAYNQTIGEMSGVIGTLRDAYGLPSGSAIPVPWPPEKVAPEEEPASGDAKERAPADLGTRAAPASALHGGGAARGPSPGVHYALLSEPPRPSASQDIERGKKLFNAVYGCAHCHGTDAKSAEEHTDLRLLERRYGAQADSVFYATVENGRDGTAMPPWGGIIEQEKVDHIKEFIFSVQK